MHHFWGGVLRLYMFLYKFPFGPFSTNALLLGCAKTKVAAIIDPAMGSSSSLLEKAKECGLTIQKILLTHSHWDHFADAAEVVEKTKAPLFVHPLDAQNLAHPGADGIPLLFPIKPVKQSHFLQEGDAIQLGELLLEVIHTPGHSPGGVCFYLRKQNVLISGDTLFQGSMGNLQFPTSNAENMWVSLKKLAKLPPATRVVPGHGGDTTIAEENWLSRAKELFSS